MPPVSWKARFARPAALAAVVGLVMSLFLQPVQPAQAALITDCDGNGWGGVNVTVDTTSSLMGGQHYDIGTFTINGGITLLVCNTGDGGDGSLTISADSFVINGTIDGNERGSAGGVGAQGANSENGFDRTGGCLATIETCPSLNGAGGGGPSNGDSGSGGGGGGYVAGGAGGAGENNTAGTAGGAYGATNDSLIQEGSGGGGRGAKNGDANDTGGAGGAGGARIRLITSSSTSGTITIAAAGIISANGAVGEDSTATGSSGGGGGGGSGGGIYLRAATITNNGTVTANGGNGGAGAKDKAGGGGGGGGGRIKFHSVNTPTDGTRSATGWTGGSGVGTGADGAAGTAGTITNTTEATPTVVTVGSLAVVLDGTGKRMVRWATAMELQTSGFNIYRSFSVAGPFVKINEGLIPAKRPGSIFGGEYLFSDGTVESGRVHYYKIEELDFTGQSLDIFGPFTTGPEDAIVGGSVSTFLKSARVAIVEAAFPQRVQATVAAPVMAVTGGSPRGENDGGWIPWLTVGGGILLLSLALAWLVAKRWPYAARAKR